MIYIVWCVFFCFCLLYVLTIFFSTPRFVQPQTSHKSVSNVDVSYLERLIKNGVISPFASYKDVELLKKHGLFQTLPLIKLYSPTEQELEECAKLQKKYCFTTYVIDSDFNNFQTGFIYLKTGETSPQILFALNRLKLVVDDEQMDSIALSKANYTKTVCDGVKYEFNSTELLEDKIYNIEEYLPTSIKSCFVVRSGGYKTELEDVLSGEKFYIFSNKKIIVKYEKIMKKLIFYIFKITIHA